MYGAVYITRMGRLIDRPIESIYGAAGRISYPENGKRELKSGAIQERRAGNDSAGPEGIVSY